MKVFEIMSEKIDSIQTDTPLKEVANKMASLKVGFVPVMKESKVVGVVTDRDIVLRAIGNELTSDVKVSQVMTEQVYEVDEDEELAAAAKIMEEHKIRRLVVVDKDKQYQGILTFTDIASKSEDADFVGNVIHSICRSISA